MYGFCGLKEPGATLPRYILINWVSRWERQLLLSLPPPPSWLSPLWFGAPCRRRVGEEPRQN